MPNWVQGKLTIEGKDIDKVIENITDGTDEQRFFDFNKIIKMPESLEISSGTTSDDCAAIFLNHFKREKVNDKKQFLQYKEAYENGNFHTNWKLSAKEYRRRIDKILSFKGNEIFKDELSSKEEIFERGKLVLDNIINYGAKDWYYWSIKNWGTKWNAHETEIYDNTIYFETAWSDVRGLIFELSKMFPKNTFTYKYAEEQGALYCGEVQFKNGEVIYDLEYPEFSKEAYECYFDLWGGEEEYHYNEKIGTYEYNGNEIEEEDESDEGME